jgi:hypothetical protein
MLAGNLRGYKYPVELAARRGSDETFA